MIDLRNQLNIECPRAKGAYLENVPAEIWGDPEWVLEPKYDGERWTQQIGEQKSLMIGRNRYEKLKGVKAAGKFVDQTGRNPYLDRVAHPPLADTIFDGESLEMFKADGTPDKYTQLRIAEGMFTGYVTWGVLFWKGQDVRYEEEWYRYRLAALALDRMRRDNVVGSHRIRLVQRLPATAENLQKLFERGFEGAIAKHLRSALSTTARTCATWWKIKGDKNRTVDAFIIGVSQAKEGGSGVKGILPKENGKAATFTVAMMKDGRVMEVGKMFNLPEEWVEEGWRNYDKYAGRVVEMRVSGWDGAALRWPRFVKWREDKAKDDCRFDEQVGRHRHNGGGQASD